MLVVVLCGFLLNATWHAGRAVLGYATNVSAYSLLSDTNIQRSDNGESALSLNDKLAKAAQTKANDMAKRDYWSHVTPDGEQPWQFITNAGYAYLSAGENLAYGFDTSNAAVAGWMNSPSHRANILNANYKEVGFGIANAPSYQGAGEETIIVAMYGQPQYGVVPVTTTAPASTNQTAPNTVATPSANQKPQTIGAKQVSRIDVLTGGNAEWAALVISLLATISVITLVLKHARVWKRYLIKGETFFIKHPLLDTIFVAVGVIGFILTRASGFIQ